MSQSKDWEARLEKALRLWRALQARAQPLEEWVTEAGEVLQQDGDNVNDLIANHRVRTVTSACLYPLFVFGVG